MCSWNHWIVIKDECVMIPWWNWEKWKIVDNVFVTLNLKNGILQHPRQVKIYIPVFVSSFVVLDHETTLNILEFFLNSIKKSKSWVLLSSMCMFPQLNGTKFWYHNFHLQNSGALQTRIDQKGYNEFWKLSNTKMNTTNS